MTLNVHNCFFCFFLQTYCTSVFFLRREAAQEHFNLKVDELKRKPVTDHPWERFHYDLVEQNLKLFHHLKKTVITENCYQQVPPTTWEEIKIGQRFCFVLVNISSHRLTLQPMIKNKKKVSEWTDTKSVTRPYSQMNSKVRCSDIGIVILI